MRQHWYKIIYVICPVCAKDKTYRVRVYGKRPKSYTKRHAIEVEYDYCEETLLMRRRYERCRFCISERSKI